MTMSVHRRKVVIEAHDGYWLAMDEHGDMREHATATDAYRTIVRVDKAAAKAGTSTVTEIEWRNVPAGFVTPGGSAV